MAKVWEVAPHPDATEREAPGGFREHDTHPFGGGMRPPPWTQVPDLLADWASWAFQVASDTGHHPVLCQICRYALPGNPPSGP